MAQAYQLKAILSAVDKLSPTLKAINTASRATRKSLADIGKATGQLSRNLMLPGAITGTAALAGLVAAGSKIVGVSAQFEDFSATLETVLGSAGKAQAAMAWVEKFATDTPYELDQVTRAFVAMQTLGVDPMKGSLKAMGDAAAVMNRPLEEASNAFASALRGNTEMLDQFGIQAKIVKGQMVLTWNEQGKQFGATVDKMNQKAIASNITHIWERMFGGAMEKKAKTWNGIVSNLSDQFTRFIRIIGSAGAFDYAKSRASALLEKINELDKNGTLKKWAEQISTRAIGTLKRFETAVRSIDVDKFLAGVDRLAAGFNRLAGAVGGVENLLLGFGGIILANIVAHVVSAAAAVARLGVALAALMMAQPVLLAIAGVIAVIGVAGWKLYQNWDAIKAGLVRTWEDFRDAVAGVADFIENRFAALLDTLRGWGASIKGIFSDPLGAISGAFGGGSSSAGKMLPGGVKALAEQMGSRYGVDPRLIQAVIAKESAGNPSARSPVGAMGLMQLMPGTFKQWGQGNPWNPAANVAAGTSYLRYLLTRYGGNTSKALAAYNAGPGKVDKYGGIPPFAETQGYVRDVLANYRGLSAGDKVQPLDAYRNPAGAEVTVRFENAPKGMRVEPPMHRAGTRVNAKVGYRNWSE